MIEKNGSVSLALRARKGSAIQSQTRAIAGRLSPSANIGGNIELCASLADLKTTHRRPITPGHAMYMVESKGQKLLSAATPSMWPLRGSTIPRSRIGYDVGVARAEREHWRQFSDAVDDGDLICGTHLPFSGHVRRDGKREGLHLRAVECSAAED